MSRSERPHFTYLGHSAVRCDLPGGEVVLIDPWVDGNPSCPPASRKFDRIDAILVTHGHFDHVGDTVALARRFRPQRVVSSYEVCSYLERQGVASTSAMNVGGCQEVLGCQVVMVRADHSSGIGADEPLIEGGCPAGFVVRLPGGFTFYHAGDTALFSDMQLIAELYRPELAFVPIGDRFTMDPAQAARACRFLGVRTAIPIHWGTFPLLTGTPQAFEKAVGDLGINCEIVTLRPGDSF